MNSPEKPPLVTIDFKGFQFEEQPLPITDIVYQLRIRGSLPYSAHQSSKFELPEAYRSLKEDLKAADYEITYASHLVDFRRLEPDSGLWNYILEVRRWLQNEICHYPALLNDPKVATDAMFYGAIPDEDTGFFHLLQADQSHCCYECGLPSSVKFVDKKVIFRGAALSASEIAPAPVAWCVPCGDQEPPTNVRYETLVGPHHESLWVH